VIAGPSGFAAGSAGRLGSAAQLTGAAEASRWDPSLLTHVTHIKQMLTVIGGKPAGFFQKIGLGPHSPLGPTREKCRRNAGTGRLWLRWTWVRKW